MERKLAVSMFGQKRLSREELFSAKQIANKKYCYKRVIRILMYNVVCSTTKSERIHI